VVHKAIEREPGRRYADAAALAANLRRYVEGRPIRARRVSVPEHAWRWCRRNPAAAAFLAMAVGTAVSTWQAVRARRAEAEMRAVLEFVEERVFASAETWEKRGGSDADSLYTAACFRAVIAAALRAADQSPAGAKPAEAEADRAMAWLERAVAAGYREAANMAVDHDLDALRHRTDFKVLLARMSASQPK
jgi:hypothetical protein